jgi:hypothetical protein
MCVFAAFAASAPVTVALTLAGLQVHLLEEAVVPHICAQRGASAAHPASFLSSKQYSEWICSFSLLEKKVLKDISSPPMEQTS